MTTDWIKLHRSDGVRVSAKVHGLLKAGNQARDARDYGRAASLYRDALQRDPRLAHIWVQLGHMLSQGKDHHGAELAYREALRLGPDSEPHLHLGHLYKELGQIALAARSYLAAARADPTNAAALSELHTLMARNIEIRPEDIMAITGDDLDFELDAAAPQTGVTDQACSALDMLSDAFRKAASPDRQALLETIDGLSAQLRALAEDDPQADAAATRSAIVFDVSDLLSYFNRDRLPTGIQRVQIEVIGNALHQAAQPIRICAFMEHRDEWVEISPALFLVLCRLSLLSGDLKDPKWIAALTRLRLTMTMSERLQFPRGAFLVNLGTSWWLQNYFLYVRQAKLDYGIHYVPFVHDLIPVMASEHCTPELTKDFISWAVGAFAHADYFFVNSQATKRDLLRVATYLGQTVDTDNIVVVPLNADFRKPATTPLSRNELFKWGIGRSDFVLFVSTIESRKNHIGAFEAWINLINRHGAAQTPKLVCVGNRGWLNDAVFARLASHDGLRDKVVMLSGLSDAELDLLYRSCLFTLYPSNYEGWGLPVTESLCYGKVPVLSDTSSLPEAGGDFAVYFEAGSTPRLTSALETLIFDTHFRDAMAAKVATDFRPRTWADIADQIAGSIAVWSTRAEAEDPQSPAPIVKLGAYHPITRNDETRIWPGMRSGEIFRAGSGWWGPDNWGCWTKAQGGCLEIGVPEGLAGALHLYVLLHGLPTHDCPWTATVNGGATQRGVVRPGAFKWKSLDIDLAPGDRALRLSIEGAVTQDLRTVTNGQDPRIVSIGVAGFFLCRANDIEAKSSFLEAVALGNVDDLAFNREDPALEAQRDDRPVIREVDADPVLKVTARDDRRRLRAEVVRV